MEVVYSFLDSILKRYDVLAIIIAIFFVVYAIYNRIKYLCLEKAAKMVAKVEGNKELSGEEKFSLCILWITEELPKVFKNSIFKALIEKIVQYAYDNSFEYATNYIERKTGTNIETIVEAIKQNTGEDLGLETENNKNTENGTSES